MKKERKKEKKRKKATTGVFIQTHNKKFFSPHIIVDRVQIT
jgi:hypothetical protein